MIQFDTSACPEAATKDLPFLAIGSGQAIADPFLAFIRRIFWPDHEPNLAEGQFAIWWTLNHAIKCSAGGVSDPKQIIVIEKNQKGTFVARELADSDMQEHAEAIDAAEAHMRKFEPNKKSAAPTEIPKMPEPPASKQ